MTRTTRSEHGAVQRSSGGATLDARNLGDAYFPLRTLARYSGLCVRTLRGYLTNGVSPLPYFRIGGKILVRRSDFDTWAARFRVETPATVDRVVRDVLADLGLH